MGKRVEIPTYTDRWIRGDRYGEVVGARGTTPEGDPESYRVLLDKSQVAVWVNASQCKPVGWQRDPAALEDILKRWDAEQAAWGEGEAHRTELELSFYMRDAETLQDMCDSHRQVEAEFAHELVKWVRGE